MTVITDQLTQIYRLTARHLFALPLIFALPVFAEAIQHVVEFSLGMFLGGDGIQPGRETAIRMGIGGVKVSTILFTLVVTARYFLHDFDPHKALTFSSASRNAILVSIAFVIALVVVLSVGGPWLSDVTSAYLPFVPTSLRRFIPVVVLLAATYSFQKKTFGIMAEILDDTPLNATHGAVASQVWMRDSWLPLLIATAPPMVLHYKLNIWAVDAVPALQLALLAADSVLVGMMAVLIAAATFETYQNAKLSDQKSCGD